MKPTKQQFSKSLSNLTRKNKHNVRTMNQGINRTTILSSSNNLRLPSAKGTMRLKTMCDEALKVVEEAEERYKERAKITEHSTFIKDKYKNDPTALEELPHIYLNDKRLRTLSSQLAEATALYEAIATAYERRTGKKHKRHVSEQVNAPIALGE